MTDSILLIQSCDNKNQSMGTGFVCYQDKNGSYILTCSHVLEDVVTPKVDGITAEVVADGASQDIDLALLYVKGLKRDVLSLQDRDCSSSDIELIGYSLFSRDKYQSKKKEVTLLEEVKLQKKDNSSSQKSWQIIAKEHYHIESGNSGSPLFCPTNNSVIAVVSNNHTTQIGYAVSIKHLKDIWKEIPKELFSQPLEAKSNFIHDVFEELDKHPMLLFSPDSYNHIDYIEQMRKEAIALFGDSYLLEINCGRYHNLKDSNRFFNRLSKRLGLGDEVEDSMDFEDVLIERFKQADPFKSFLLIVGFERLHEDVRNSFAETLRNLNEEYGGYFNLVIFGGQKLIQLKYSTGIHSYFNNFEQKIIPPFSFEKWKERYSYLTQKIYNEIVSVTGEDAKLSEVCFKAKVKTQKEAKELLVHSLWSSELFRAYRKEKDKLSLLLSKEELGAFHPYCDNELLYKLYWDNLIKGERGKFVWRSAFLVEMGREFLGYG